jgi:hypothetical protein
MGSQFFVLETAVFFNGVFDVLCAAAILALPKKPLGELLPKLHLSVFACTEEDVEDAAMAECEYVPASVCLRRRIVAYWILTYGIVRTLAAICMVLNENEKGQLLLLVAATYFVEGISFALEDLLFMSTIRKKSSWIYASSFALGIWTMLEGLEVI